MREFCKACNVNYQAKIGHDSGCPYCTLERLEAENARLREAAESLLDSVKPRFDLQHNKIVPDFSLDKLREALESSDE